MATLRPSKAFHTCTGLSRAVDANTHDSRADAEFISGCHTKSCTRAPAAHANAEARYNRSFEYDALGDRYARFLIEEILPEVGKKLNLTTDPNLRGLMGSSSGAIAAFNAAWERPDAFRKVLSSVGSFTHLRGGNAYPALVRKTEPKPIVDNLFTPISKEKLLSRNAIVKL